jgi:hypothetical protein
LAYIGVTVCGIVLAATPLALWVAWTPNGFLVVLATAAVSVVSLGVLLSRLSRSGEAADGGNDDGMRRRLPERFVEEIHAIYPLNYHHSRIEKPRFRRTMDRLRRMMQ